MSHQQPQAPENGNTTNVSVERTQHEMTNTVVDAEMTPMAKDEEKLTLAQELQLSHGNSSSSGDEEEAGCEKKKKKDAAKEELEHKITDEELEAGRELEKESFPGNKPDEAMHLEEKNSILEKIKEKLPGHRKDEEVAPECAPEKKGILEKIKEKIPGCHKVGGDARKDDWQ
ncbi:phosphoprotein ECPP44-like [Rhodamnia argentea]|uniref:Phosphoprotein ECPP44-like n=1 Tax=Rhodamnia argentea TaxID=178133 RepID=A0A8B8NKM6_9MYRT|nr:phosphoprotein ECPP44-like [Rhodamnia argentea]